MRDYMNLCVITGVYALFAGIMRIFFYRQEKATENEMFSVAGCLSVLIQMKEVLILSSGENVCPVRSP